MKHIKTEHPFDLIVITGPTATGKTRLAAELAYDLDAEIIGADSRQVYTGMDIGTGKDLADYVVEGKIIPSHLVDRVEPGYEFNVFEFQEEFFKAFQHIRKRGKQAIMCGGTGMYIEAALASYKMLKVPENKALRKKLETLTHQELVEKLETLRPLHNTTDITLRDRLIRAIEIESYQQAHMEEKVAAPDFSHIIFALNFPRDVIRERITQRLRTRLENGMVDEIQKLLKTGLKPEQLTFYGLEYKYITLYVTGEITWDEMFTKLNTAIHQFAKRQMTWFRRMEKNGFQIHWIDGMLDNSKKIEIIKEKVCR
ncbi:MAG: tRNA (adenosine(37)-N6)-dimethylallyltransferase MiaA [Bacteroidetes bacterium]|nr:MAG: tRNA (adenosine(37)-N6)-dimethylallyltransferase MiaA [Bacteroidota bacterium]